MAQSKAFGNVAKTRDIVNLTDPRFGGKGDGVTDNTAALIAAMNFAFADSNLDRNKVLVIPYGDFLFTQNNPFGQWSVATPARRNVTVMGFGRRSTTIRFRPGGSSDAYFYDSGDTGSPTDQQLIKALFEKIGFVFDETGMSGGRLHFGRLSAKTGVPNQNWQFRDCDWEGPTNTAFSGDLLQLRDLINNSEHSFHNCRSRRLRHIIESTNPQAVNHYAYGCDWELQVGDMYKYTSGGGQLTHVGGSLIFDGLSSDAYILNLAATALGQSTTFNFVGVRAELRGANAKILNSANIDISSRVNFYGANFEVATGGDRTAVSVLPDSNIQVTFRECSLAANSGGGLNFEFKAAQVSSYQVSKHVNAEIHFIGCRLPRDIHSRLAWGTNAVGLFRIRSPQHTAGYTADEGAFALECDRTGALGFTHPYSSNSAQLKTFMGYVRRWPDSGGGTDGGVAKVTLPPGSMLKNLTVRKIPLGSSTAAYRLAITNDDGTHCYGFLGNFNGDGQQRRQHEGSFLDIWRLLPSGVDQNVRIIATKELAYNTKTAAFTVGATLTDAVTATTAKILADMPIDGTSGVLRIGLIAAGTGAFGVGNAITDGSGGSATAGATTSYQGGSVAQVMAAGDIFAIEYY